MKAKSSELVRKDLDSGYSKHLFGGIIHLVVIKSFWKVVPDGNRIFDYRLGRFGCFDRWVYLFSNGKSKYHVL